MNNSMYSYVENNPIAAIDDGGKKVIYVSGYYHPAGNLLKGFLPATGGYGYWDYFDPSFVPQSRKLIGATSNESNLFVDGVGEAWSSSKSRFDDGVQYAREHYDELIEGMNDGEAFEFVSHSQGGAFAAGMASYLQSRGQTVKSMLYLSPHQPEDIPKVLGTFSLEVTYKNDLLANGKPINGVNINMVFSNLNGETLGILDAHGATVTADNIKKINGVLGQLGPYVYGALEVGKWTITEDEKGNITFTRVHENGN